MSKIGIICCLCLGMSFYLTAQTTPILLEFSPHYLGQPLSLEEIPFSHETTKESLTIEMLRYYVSNIVLLKAGEAVFLPTKQHHLIDASIPSSLKINVDNAAPLAFDAIRFELGVDSLTQMDGAMGGDLDPTKGMYWTWQSGYIHFKLEGSSSRCTNKDKSFVYHVGGYTAPFNTLQIVELAVKKQNPSHVLIQLDLHRLLNQIDLSTSYHIMSPNAAAVDVAAMISSCFSIAP